MITYGLSLGSNQGDRLENLNKALSKLKAFSQIKRISPAFENPPLLPKKAPADWFYFFLNITVEIQTSLSPQELLKETQKIETDLGRSPEHLKWSPRTIDIDLLYSDQASLKTPTLNLPHSSMFKRNFVLSPLSTIQPNKIFNNQEVLKLSRKLTTLSSLMTIINVTPDSFSETKETINYDDIFSKLKNSFNQAVQYIDIGAESTRPGAMPLNHQQEWQRLEPVLDYLRDLKFHNPFTKVSLDTYHPETAKKALDYPVDILNDVSGLHNPTMIELAPEFEAVIVMHSLSVPADKNKVFSEDINPVNEIKNWILIQSERLKNIDSDKIIFDPGLGFGKTAMQSIQILQNIPVLLELPFRLLIGHSRKSFLNLWANKDFAHRDLETLTISLYLQSKGVDILRVHNPELHQTAFKSFLACQGPQ